MGNRHPADVIDPVSGKVRVMSRQCSTCIFWPGNRMHLRPGRFEEVIRSHLESGALLTSHSTLSYGDHPKFGPAVCAGFWARYGMQTAAGRFAKLVIGIIRVDPPPPHI
jgi:hypothetical protein